MEGGDASARREALDAGGVHFRECITHAAPADDPVRRDDQVFADLQPVPVDPDRVDAHVFRPAHIRVEVVANVPRLFRQHFDRCERMVEELTGEPHTYHTTNPVSLWVIGDGYLKLRPRGALCDVAPTVLELMGVPQPLEMTGRSLIEHA